MNQRNFEKSSKNKLSPTNTRWIFILNLQLQLIGWLTQYAYCFSLTLSAFEPIFGLFACTIWHVSSTVPSFHSEMERRYKTQLMADSCVGLNAGREREVLLRRLSDVCGWRAKWHLLLGVAWKQASVIWKGQCPLFHLAETQERTHAAHTKSRKALIKMNEVCSSARPRRYIMRQLHYCSDPAVLTAPSVEWACAWKGEP